MRIKNIRVYNFEELTPEARSRVLKDYADINTDFNWYEDELDYWKEKLSEYGFRYPEIYFSGFYSQGDGACFEFRGLDIDKIWPFYTQHNKVKHEAGVRYYLQEYHHFKTRTLNSRYSHERTREVDYESYCNHDYPHLNQEFKRFEDWLEGFRLGLCREIYRNLEDEYDSLTQHEAIVETIKANEYEFTETGLIA